MSVLPRWNDGFSSDPFSDPAYSITSGASGWTYNGTTDRLENTTVGLVSASAALLSSNNSSGIVEADIGYYYTNSNDSSISLRAFGYNFIVGETSTGAGAHKYVIITDESVDPSTINSSASIQNQSAYFVRQPYRLQGDITLKVISTPVGVDFYIDSLLLTTQPYKKSASTTRVFFTKSGGTSGGTIHFSRLLVKADASVPKTPTIITPGLSGALTTVTGPIVVDVPDSRLYVDLGPYAGRIGTGGLTGVVYDPNGANVAMTEDTGIPDGSGGTTGDYYLEAPVRGVSSDNRLVLKEDFVTTNSVAATDQIVFSFSGITVNTIDSSDCSTFTGWTVVATDGTLTIVSNEFKLAPTIALSNANNAAYRQPILANTNDEITFDFRSGSSIFDAILISITDDVGGGGALPGTENRITIFSDSAGNIAAQRYLNGVVFNYPTTIAKVSPATIYNGKFVINSNGSVTVSAKISSNPSYTSFGTCDTTFNFKTNLNFHVWGYRDFSGDFLFFDNYLWSSPTNNGFVAEEDDLQCHVEKYGTISANTDVSKVIYPKATNISLHNSNADGNDAFVLGGPRSNVIDDNILFSLILTSFSSSATLPIIFDFDLGKIRKIKGIRWGYLTTDSSTGKNPFSCDLYSKTTPFSGPGLGQGTLDSDNYPGLFTASPVESNSFDELAGQFNAQEFTPALDIKTRYLRMVFNTDNFTSSGSNYLIAREMFFIESDSIDTINSVDDNAQFEFDPGGGYVAFPGAGVTQDSGTVRVTLPSALQHDGEGYTNYYKIYFKPDITD